jgi:hypothetical protein
MQETMVKVRALFKAQSALTRIELRAREQQAAGIAVALVFGLLALSMLNVAAFLALASVVGTAWSALILGVADLLFAGLVAKEALGVSTGSTGEMAKELRDLCVDSLAADAEELKDRLQGAAGLLPGMSSVVGLLTSTLKKKKKS